MEEIIAMEHIDCRCCSLLEKYKNIKIIKNYNQKIESSTVILCPKLTEEKIIKHLTSQDPKPKIIALINPTYERRESLFRMGIDDYLALPLSINEITRKIPALIHKNLSPQERILRTAQGIISNNIEKKLSIKALCQQIGTNPNTLYKVFQNYTNMTAYEWAIYQKMNHAARLLIHSDYEIYRISLEVGYNDANNFSTAFKKKFGMPPKKYRISNKPINKTKAPPEEQDYINNQY